MTANVITAAVLITSRKANKVKLADQLRCYLRVHACLLNIKYSCHVHFHSMQM